MIVGAGLSIVPFIHSVEDIIFFFYIFARVGGLFLIAPLLSNYFMPVSLRIFLTVMISLLLGMVLYSDYRGPDPTFVIKELTHNGITSLFSLTVAMIQELSIGFLIGFSFIILYEATLLAGQFIGVMMGFSITEILDPVSNISQGLLGQLFSLATVLTIVSFDLHHQFIKVLAHSFTVLPLGQYHLPYELLQDITHGTGRLFQHGFQIGAIPFSILFLVTIALGFMARVMPEMNIFMVGFPLKIFIGYYGLLLTMNFFPFVLRQIFAEYYNLANRVIHHMGTGL